MNNKLIKRIDQSLIARPKTWTDDALLRDCRTEIERLRQGLWDCYKAAGADTDGNKTPHAIEGDLVKICVTAVKELSNDYSEAIQESKPYVPMTEKEFDDLYMEFLAMSSGETWAEYCQARFAQRAGLEVVK